MAPFGMNERLVRTSVFRLVRDGWLGAQSRGRRSRYRLTREGARRFDQAHHRIYTPPNPDWDGDWEVVLAPPDTAGPAARLKLGRSRRGHTRGRYTAIRLCRESCLRSDSNRE